MVACPFPKPLTADLRWLLKCVLTLGMDPTFLCVPFQPCLFFSNIIFKGRQKTLSKRRQNPFYFQFDLLVLCLRRFWGGACRLPPTHSLMPCLPLASAPEWGCDSAAAAPLPRGPLISDFTLGSPGPLLCCLNSFQAQEDARGLGHGVLQRIRKPRGKTAKEELGGNTPSLLPPPPSMCSRLLPPHISFMWC